MSDASMPHCSRCGRVEYDCSCPDRANDGQPMWRERGLLVTNEQAVTLAKAAIDSTYPSGWYDPDLLSKVAAAIQWAVLDERERCAKLVERLGEEHSELTLDTGSMIDPETTAAAIREVPK